MNRLMDLYGQGYQSSDGEVVDTRTVMNNLMRNQAYEQSVFGKVNALLKAQTDKLEGSSGFNPVNMLLEGAKTANRWLGATQYPEQVQYQDILAPLGVAAMTAPFMPRNALRSAGGKLATAAAPSAPEPQGIRGVHYTTSDFDRFDPSKFGGAGDAFGLGVYSTPMDFVQTQVKRSGKAFSYGDRYHEGARSIPTEHLLSKPFNIEMYPPSGTTDWSSLRANWFGPKWHHDMSPYEAAEAGIFQSREEAAKAFNAALKAHGYDGVQVYDGGTMREVMAIEPGRVRSSTTGETLFADQSRSSVPGTVVNAQGQGEGDPIEGILSRYGLLP